MPTAIENHERRGEEETPLRSLARGVFDRLRRSPDTAHLTRDIYSAAPGSATVVSLGEFHVRLQAETDIVSSLTFWRDRVGKVVDIRFSDKEIGVIELGSYSTLGLSLLLGGKKVDLEGRGPVTISKYKDPLGWKNDRVMLESILDWVTTSAEKGKADTFPKFVFDFGVVVEAEAE